jgi:hypothetical protein
MTDEVVTDERCPRCGVAAPPDPTGARCQACVDLPHETSLVNRLGPADSLDLLACQVIGLRWEACPRGVAEVLGLTTWEQHAAMNPDAIPADRPFGWWPSLDTMLAAAWRAYGNGGEGNPTAIQRWLGPMHYGRAREAHAVSLGRERRRSTPVGVAT